MLELCDGTDADAVSGGGDVVYADDDVAVVAYGVAVVVAADVHVVLLVVV